MALIDMEIMRSNEQMDMKEMVRFLVLEEMDQYILGEENASVGINALLKDSRIQEALRDTAESTAFANLMYLWCLDGVSSREIYELVNHRGVLPTYDELETFKRINSSKRVRKM